MITSALQWTETARTGLDRYFAERLTPQRLEGADAGEVRSDLEAHLEQELLQEGVSVVTLEDLRRTLARIGESLPPPAAERNAGAGTGTGIEAGAGDSAAGSVPGPVSAERNSPVAATAFPSSGGPGFQATPAPGRSPVPPGIGGHGWIKFAGLWWPLVVFVFEVITRGCAGTLFDPMPDVTHHLLVLLVPVTAWTFLRAARPDAAPWLKVVTPWLAGMALSVSLYYFLRFMPATVLAVPGVIFFGVGLLALGPLMAFTAMLNLRRRFRKYGSLRDRRGLSIGFWLMTGALVLVEFTSFITSLAVRTLTEKGDSPDPADWAAATRLVRRFGSERALLRSCYPRAGSVAGVDGLAFAQSWAVSQFFSQGRSPSLFFGDVAAEVSRDLYYRVTGRSFDGQDFQPGYRPLMFTEFNSRRNFLMDDDRGGTRVAGRIPGLSLGEGRLDWHCEEASGLTWGELTLTFENAGDVAQEARCRIALPPDGFVSRVTLWVNGEPQEAAYSTVAKVRNAYEQVAVRERRDPVLVTQPDAGSILVQAFPVPAHGQLRTRISFTAPAGLDSRVWLPSIQESNFTISPSAPLPLWVQADRGSLELPAALRAHTVTEAGAPTATASLTAADITGAGRSFFWRHQPRPVVFCTDPFAAPERKTVIRTLQNPAPAGFKPQSVAWVIDTSAPMESHRQAIEEAMKKGGFSPAGQSAVFLPDDSNAGVISLTDGGAPPRLDFAGGRDNTAALLAALEWLRGRPDAALIWIHGPQPLQQSRREALDQLLDRGVTPVTVVDVPLIPGENRLSPHLSARERIRLIPVRPGAEGTTLGSVVESAFAERGVQFSAQPAETPAPEGAVKVRDSLARWNARLETSRLGLRNAAEASALAASRQIVTPWSGAVVLERSEDYARNGLEQADVSVSQQVPVIPEPSSALLVILSAGPWLFRRRR